MVQSRQHAPQFTVGVARDMAAYVRAIERMFGPSPDKIVWEAMSSWNDGATYSCTK